MIPKPLLWLMLVMSIFAPLLFLYTWVETRNPMGLVSFSMGGFFGARLFWLSVTELRRPKK